MKFEEAQTNIRIADARATVQVAAAKGKIIAASFLDNDNILLQIRGDEAFMKRAESFKPSATFGAGSMRGQPMPKATSSCRRSIPLGYSPNPIAGQGCRVAREG